MNDDVTGEVGWLEHGSLRKMHRPTFVQYLGLFVIILFGVAGGILLASWITATVAEAPAGSVAERASHVAGEIGSEIHAVFQHATTKRNGQPETPDSASPASSETGRNLAQQCEDWRRAYEQGHSPTARAEMERICGRYEAFLESVVRSSSRHAGDP